MPFPRLLVFAFAIASALALTACATPTQLILDAEVKRLCAKDGGPHVYETVPISLKEAKVPYKGRRRDEPYFYHTVFEDLKGGGGEASALLFRSSFRIVRASDGGLLGEYVRYGRRGGDIPGPWHPSSYLCPERGGSGHLSKLIFVGGGQ
jgi:hypothetical protein